jgi:hypothetical protein
MKLQLFNVLRITLNSAAKVILLNLISIQLLSYNEYELAELNHQFQKSGYKNGEEIYFFIKAPSHLKKASFIFK